MLNSIEHIQTLVDAMSHKPAMQANAERLISNIKAVTPEYSNASMLTLLTPGFQERLFTYIGTLQQRSTHTLLQRQKAMKAICRDAIKLGWLPNIPLFRGQESVQKEIKGLRFFGYRNQISTLVTLFFTMGETLVGIMEDQQRRDALLRQRRLIGLSLLSITLCGMDLHQLAALRRTDFSGTTLTIAEGVNVEIPEVIATIISDLASSRRERLFDIVGKRDSAKKQSAAIAALKCEMDAALTKANVALPITSDPLLVWSVYAHESGIDAPTIRSIIASRLDNAIDAESASIMQEAMRKVSEPYADMTRSWYCFMSNGHTPAFIRSRILESQRCPADVEFFLPKDIIYEKKGGKTIPVENPFFSQMLLVGCNFLEARRIDEIVGRHARLYGFTDSEGRFHCRISHSEKELLEQYVSIESKRKLMYTPSADLIGKRVLIKSGHFKGMHATITRHHDRLPKSDIALEFFGRPIAILRSVSDTTLTLLDN